MALGDAEPEPGQKENVVSGYVAKAEIGRYFYSDACALLTHFNN